MPDIGWSEMAVIALLTLIVIGPKELPRVMRTVGHWIRKAQSLAREFQSGLDQMVQEADLEDAKKMVDMGRNLNVNKIVENAIDPTGSVRDEATELQAAVRDEAPADGPDEPAAERPETAPGGTAEEDPAQATIDKSPVQVAPPHSLKPSPEPGAEPEPEPEPELEPAAEPEDGSQKTA
jgi:sec-independent protein translocase protein TatB